MRRVLIRLMNAVLFTTACWLVSIVFNEIMAERLKPRSASFHEARSEAPEVGPVWDERKVIIDRNLFGAKVARNSTPAPPPVVEEVEEVEETKLPLELLGTLWSSDATMSTAAIRDTGNRIEQVVAVGESLEERGEVQVAAIERGRVILLNGARREELLLSDAADTRGGASRPPPGASASKSRGARSRRSSLQPSQGERGSPAAQRRAARTQRAQAKARKRRLSGKDRLNEMNKLATGGRSKPKASGSSRPRPDVTAQEQAEAGQVMKSLLDSGAGPDEILQRMQELESRHLGSE